MRMAKAGRLLGASFIYLLFVSLLNVEGTVLKNQDNNPLRLLLPEVSLWKFSEPPQSYSPGTLFEYINGAAESYLSYDFRELIVGQYKREHREGALTLEIYDMGSERNSFGIYSVERFPDNNFISVGIQGYLEEGTLNFIVGKFYVKLICFDCGQDSDEILKLFSEEVVKKVKDRGSLPALFSLFPKEGLVQNSEKFIFHNFLGYSFLHQGYISSYKLGDLDFECFLIEGKDEEDAQSMLEQYLKTKDKQVVQEISLGYFLKDRYYHNTYLARIKNFLCGVIKIKDGFEKIGDKYLRMLIESLKRSQSFPSL